MIVLSFGFIRKDKGYEYLLEAFSNVLSHVNNAVLIIAGSPKSDQDKMYLNCLRELKTKLGLNSEVIFDSRYLSDSEIETYVEAADVVVLPLLRNVGASGPLHHALSMGKPVIATRTGHLSVMEDVLTLVRPRDVSELYGSMIKILMDNEFGRRQVMHELQYAQAHEWPAVCNSNLEVYQSVLRH